ncbi:MAG: lipid IV(A) 3-deoxy-D-manno-octulosonic acid transferase [Desulfohalobiaceae bacterium]|nr:lipid IV(A) 3-deoxy-D-manno-octulosonic acid transferase [Desulfohalobiaceae bacterium]
MQKLIALGYSTLTRTFFPLYLLSLLLKSVKAPEYRHRWPERFGYTSYPPQTGPGTIWVHAVSVGEVRAAASLIKALKKEHPKQELVVTTTTPTGSHELQQLFADTVRHSYLPYDLESMAERFLQRTNPGLALFMETEIWPNLYTKLARRSVPIIMANARLSPGSFKGYMKIRPFMADILNRCTRILAQSEADRGRFTEIGVLPQKILTTGNIKFDQPVPKDHIRSGKLLRDSIGPRRPVWIAASTHAGEDEAVLKAHAGLRELLPDCLLILVPRHPERFQTAADLAAGLGYAVQKHSPGGLVRPETAVYIGDCMGRMFTFYAASDIAFVGGSLVQTGGHNLLEPASLGLPVLSGPHLFNFQDISRLLLDQNGLLLVKDSEELAKTLGILFQNPKQARAMGERAGQVVAGNKGATDKVLQAIEPHVNQRG